MKRYYIKNTDDEYWCHNQDVGYWCKLTDNISINERSHYPYLIAKIFQGMMKNEDIITTLELKK